MCTEVLCITLLQLLSMKSTIPGVSSPQSAEYGITRRDLARASRTVGTRSNGVCRLLHFSVKEAFQGVETTSDSLTHPV